MDTQPNDPTNDAWIESLVEFDESLRQGRAPAADPELDATRQFLLRVQAIWPRSDQQKIASYNLVRTLGQGTLCTTYLVEDPRTQRAWVLKSLWPNRSADTAARMQLSQESRAIESLRHAHI